MTPSRARIVAWSCVALTIAAIPLSVYVLAGLAHTHVPVQDVWNIIGSFTGAIAFAVVGALILSRHPRHAIGWTFTLSGVATSVAVVLMAYGELSKTRSLPAGDFAAAAAYALLQGGVFIPLTLGLLLFPDGRLLSVRWWPAAIASVVALVLRLAGNTLDPTLKDEILNDLDTVGVALTIASVIAGLAALTLRWRRAGSILRQQLKWMTFAATVVTVAFVADVVLNTWSEQFVKQYEFVVFIVAYVSVPIAAAASILRYGLYEIDFIINRAIVYVAMTAILAGLYSAFTATLQRLFVAITGESSDAAIIITVALIATLFTPVRNALQKLVDKRFKDARDLTRVMSSLESEVGAVLDVIYSPRLAERLVRTAQEGADAHGAALYLDGGHEPTYTAGEWTGQAELEVPLRAGDRELGRIALTARRHGAPYTPQERERLQGAADMVAMGLALGREPQPVA